jgi:argininosuccinate synthase
MDINNENLENALSSTEAPQAPVQNAEAPQMPKEMEIGFHQGALNTLSAERAELMTMIQNVEKIMGMHIQRLEQLGVKMQKKE